MGKIGFRTTLLYHIGGFNIISKNENYILWEQRINEKNKSGLTIKEWCEKNGISRHKYSYWKHLLMKKKEKTVDWKFLRKEQIWFFDEIRQIDEISDLNFFVIDVKEKDQQSL